MLDMLLICKSFWTTKLIFIVQQAVLAAPCDEETGCSKDLSVALANRSAVLFSLKAYHLALDDIRLALESGYPKVRRERTNHKTQ